MNNIKDCLIHLIKLDGLGGGMEVPLDSLKTLSDSRELFWLHLSLPSDSSHGDLVPLGINPSILENLLSRRDRPTMDSGDSWLFLSLRAVNFNPGNSPDDMVFIRVYMRDNLILTIRKQKVLAIDRIYGFLREGRGPRSREEFLTNLLHNISLRVGELIYDLDEELDRMEEALSEQDHLPLSESLPNLRRQIINLKRYLLPQSEVTRALDKTRVSWITSETLTSLRGLCEKYLRYLEKIDSLRERAAVAQEEINSIYNQKLSKTTYLLSIVATVFLPLSFFTGLLGINVGGIPGSNNPLAFIGVCLLLLALVALELIIFRLKKWI